MNIKTPLIDLAPLLIVQTVVLPGIEVYVSAPLSYND
jgi:hypothetical protein